MYKLYELMEGGTVASTLLVSMEDKELKIVDNLVLEAIEYTNRDLDKGCISIEDWYSELVSKLRRFGVDTLPHLTGKVDV